MLNVDPVGLLGLAGAAAYKAGWLGGDTGDHASLTDSDSNDRDP
jgi:hypothetical protein